MSQILSVSSAAAEHADRRRRERSLPAIGTDTVYVAYTSIDDTFVAVRVAKDFAKALDVPVTLMHFRIVPFLLPVDKPSGMSPVETDGFIEGLRAEGLDICVRIYLCRDERRAIQQAFRPHSLIVIAGRRSWWPTESERRRRTLEAAGHFVVFVETAEHKERFHA
jgi:hypothetical protein